MTQKSSKKIIALRCITVKNLLLFCNCVKHVLFCICRIFFFTNYPHKIILKSSLNDTCGEIQC